MWMVFSDQEIWAASASATSDEKWEAAQMPPTSPTNEATDRMRPLVNPRQAPTSSTSKSTMSMGAKGKFSKRTGLRPEGNGESCCP